VKPDTLSDSSSPIALHFGQNVAFHYTSMFTYTHTHTYDCGGSGGAINIVGSNTCISESSDTHRFEILTQRILIRASVHVRVKSISGWEAVEPQTISETSSPIGFKF
jgi:hypothetical protein